MAALGASVCDDKGVMALPGGRGCATSPRSYSISAYISRSCAPPNGHMYMWGETDRSDFLKCLALRQGTSRTGRWF
jgi:hypothetical protein